MRFFIRLLIMDNLTKEIHDLCLFWEQMFALENDHLGNGLVSECVDRAPAHIRQKRVTVE